MKLSRTYIPLLDRRDRYLVLVGGGGSAKSGFSARKLLIRGRQFPQRFLIVRKVQRACLDSCWFLMKQVLEESDIPYQEHKAESRLTFPSVSGIDTEVIFGGLDNREKIKSIQGITSEWIEEATEFDKNDFLQLDLRLRDPTPDYRQIILSFNPDEAQAPWLKEMFFFGDIPETGPGKKAGSYIHHSTYLDNPSDEFRESYRAVLENLDDDVYDKIYRLGHWAAAKGLCYPNWDEWPHPFDPSGKFDAIFYGLDFGFSVNPAVLVKIYRRAKEYWLKELIYAKGLTNQELAQRTKAHPDFDINEAIIYADSENPQAIEELCRDGLLVKPARKGQGSVKAGIDFVRSCTVHMLPESTNIIKERKTYKFKEDKNGNTLPEPVKFNDHAMDAVRYGITTEYAEGMGGYDFIVLG